MERPGQIHSDDFVGCMHSISINGRLLNLTNPLDSRGVDKTCSRSDNGACYKKDSCTIGECLDKWTNSFCRCDYNTISPNCHQSFQSISVGDSGYIQFKISKKHRRMQLLENFYGGTTAWDRRNHKFKSTTKSYDPPKSLSFRFRTYKKDGVLLYAATDKYYTLLELVDGNVAYSSKQYTVVNMTLAEQGDMCNGEWHNITLYSYGRSIRLLVDGNNVGEELDAAGVHDFLDPYLTLLSWGGIKSEWLSRNHYNNFEGCLANFTINNEVQPINGNGSIFGETIQRGKIVFGCHGSIGAGLAQNPNPLNIGLTLVIVFFVILIVAILVSCIVFKLRKQKKEKGDPLSGKSNMMIHSKHNGAAMLNAPNLIAGTNDSLMNRHNETNLNSYMSDNADIMRNVGHIVGPELLSKKYKEREIMGLDPPRPQRPDIIEREVVGKSPPLREDHHPPPPPSTNTSHHTHDHQGGMDLNSEVPEHYDLENASSIAPSDIDIVYHYKGFREAGGVRKYKATPPPLAGYHHKQMSRYPPRAPPSSQAGPPRPHQSTPLARLSPSSELSQQPRILTLHDISGKPLQSALHGSSERSLTSPAMSQLSGASPGAASQVPVNTGPGAPPLGSSSLVSTLDGVSGAARHRAPPPDDRSSPDDDESGNDSFTCSEIEYDDKSDDARRPPAPPAGPSESFDSSFRGSLSTLVASDDEHAIYRQPGAEPRAWDYLMNWGANFEGMVGVFKDMAELPDAVNGRLSTPLRLPNGNPKPSEEYV